MRHFLTTLDFDRAAIERLLDDAASLKLNPFNSEMKNKTIALLFFNPSLRTRSSFQIGAQQMGGHAVILEPGRGAWPIAFDDGVVMDGDEEEHVAEVAKVLSRYADLIGVRAFPKFQSWQDDRRDKVIKAFAQYAEVPVINLETITHPCQELAHALTVREHLGRTDGKKYVLTWTYHPKPLNTAVANSGLIIAAKLGFDVTLLCPTPAYILDERYMSAAQKMCAAQGRTLTVSHDIESAYEGAHVVYAKSWGALPYFGRWRKEQAIRDAHRHFVVDEAKMARTDGAIFSHCLPARRGVKVSDGVLDSEASVHIDEAENRLHVQKAVMRELLK